jgi:hypothetical protein
MLGNDVLLAGKMLVECYLAGDSCTGSEGEEEEEVVKSEEYLAAGAVENESVSAHRCC